jgi:hypothetical protein
VKGLRRQIRDFTDSLRRDHSRAIDADARGFKHRVLRLVRLSLPPGPGRPSKEMITRAVELRAQDRPWLEVYRECIPGFPGLGEGLRQLAMTRLRSAVRSRLAPSGEKKSGIDRHANKYPLDSFVWF